jgi:hypothetical protein
MRAFNEGGDNCMTSGKTVTLTKEILPMHLNIEGGQRKYFVENVFCV